MDIGYISEKLNTPSTNHFSPMTATEFLYFLVSSLVTDIDAIEIQEKHDELGTLLSLKVAQSDMGSIIGRSGKTVDSLRTVLRVYGSKHDERVNLKIIEDVTV